MGKCARFFSLKKNQHKYIFFSANPVPGEKTKHFFLYINTKTSLMGGGLLPRSTSTEFNADVRLLPQLNWKRACRSSSSSSRVQHTHYIRYFELAVAATKTTTTTTSQSARLAASPCRLQKKSSRSISSSRKLLRNK